MHARFGGEAHRFFGISSVELQSVGKRSLEWDLSHWNWDGDLFIARPINSIPSDSMGRQFLPLPETRGSSNSSLSCSDEGNLDVEKGKRELEKRRRMENENLNDEAGNLTLKLGGRGEMANWEGTSGKKTKFASGTLNCAVCQVENCGDNLSNAKDYHRRHKVYEMHPKASKAFVGNVM